MRIGFVVAIALSVLLGSQASAATKIDDPVKFVTAFYARIADGKNITANTFPEDIYTPHLASLFALEKKDSGGEVGRLDFEFWVNGQDWQLSKIKITSMPVEGAKDREIVVAKFVNLGHAEEIHFYFEKTKSGWLLDDARSAKDNSWTLSLILKYGDD